ncbi:hypothetical protein [Streptomyces sp. NPDC101165]|uniref:hypothetical protein n=1 Tax=Streptomyces sp. NPDC101165 TaxID=3366119 RepID=UPI0038009EFF
MQTFSYDPPERSLGELMGEAQDEADEAWGEDPTLRTVELLHSKLLLSGLRHKVTAHNGPVLV